MMRLNLCFVGAAVRKARGRAFHARAQSGVCMERVGVRFASRCSTEAATDQHASSAVREQHASTR
eukprot:7337759-Lingulodinium_polyedra.AAC.1